MTLSGEGLLPLVKGLLEGLGSQGAASLHIKVQFLVKVDCEDPCFVHISSLGRDDFVARGIRHSDPCLPFWLLQTIALVQDDSAIAPNVYSLTAFFRK